MPNDGLGRFGIPDWHSQSSYDPRQYSENPEALYSDPLLNITAPNAATASPAPAAPEALPMVPATRSQLFGVDLELPASATPPAVARAGATAARGPRDTSRDTMYRAAPPTPETARGGAPEDPIEAARARVLFQPDQATPQDYWITRQADMAANAQLAAQNPRAGMAFGGTNQHSTSFTNQSGTASSASETASNSNSEQKGQTETIQQTQISPEARESLLVEDEITRQRGVVGAQMAEAQKAYHQTEAQKVGEWAVQQQKFALQAQRAAEAQQARMESINRQMDIDARDYQKTAQELDPSRLISGPKSWLAALAMGLGAFGATLGRTQNFAQQIIDQALNRDMESQKLGLQAKKDKMSLTQQILQNERTRFSSEAAARESTRAAMYGVFATQAEARALALKGTQDEAGAKQQALDLWAQQQTRKTNALMIENKAISQGTSLAQTVGHEQSNTTGFQSQSSRSDTTSDTSGTQWTRQPTAAGAGMIDTLGTAQEIAGVKKASQEAFPGANAPTKADETQFGKAQTKVAPLVELQAIGRRTLDLLGKTNFLDRELKWSSDAEALALQYANFLAKRRHALTGASANPEEMKAEAEAFIRRNWSSRALGNAIREQMRTTNFDVGGQLNVLHPRYKAELYNRLRDGGFSRDDLTEMQTLQAAPSAVDVGTRFGLTPRE